MFAEYVQSSLTGLKPSATAVSLVHKVMKIHGGFAGTLYQQLLSILCVMISSHTVLF